MQLLSTLIGDFQGPSVVIKMFLGSSQVRQEHNNWLFHLICLPKRGGSLILYCPSWQDQNQKVNIKRKKIPTKQLPASASCSPWNNLQRVAQGMGEFSWTRVLPAET